MTKVKAQYKLNGKWRQKTVNMELPTNKNGFILFETLKDNIRDYLKMNVSPNIELRYISNDNNWIS
jgi:hypothetical protein